MPEPSLPSSSFFFFASNSARICIFFFFLASFSCTMGWELGVPQAAVQGATLMLQ